MTKMILQNWEPSGDAQSLIRATDTIIAQARAKALPQAPWSLAELGLDSDDHEQLCRWADNLEYNTVDSWISSLLPYRSNEWGVTRQASFGLIFLLFASEVARRDATEGHLWTYVCRDTKKRPRFDPYTEALLFVQGQPTYELKQAIEQAARTFNLRNVFGVSGLMNWFDTVFLQFGFTRRGFTASLPWWLAGYRTTHAINWLSSEHPSTTFTYLWDSMRLLRFGNISSANFLARVRHSPWLLPEWHEEIAEQAISHPRLGTQGQDITPVETIDKNQTFLSEPVLKWYGTQSPTFTTQFQNLLDLPLEEADYTLVVSGVECAKLLRQDDGAYAPHPPGEITLPMTAPSVIACLTLPDGTTLNAQSLALYDPSEEVTAFHYPAGTKINNAWSAPLSTTFDVVLLLSHDLILVPASARWSLLQDRTRRFCHLTRGWSPETCVFLGDEEFWKPNVTQSHALSEPSWAQNIQVHWRRSIPAATPTQEVAGPEAWLWVEHPDDVRVTWVRVEGNFITRFVNEMSGRVAFGPISLLYDQVKRKIRVRLEHDDGTAASSTIICRTLDTLSAGVEGAVRQTPEGWVYMGEGTRISVLEAQREPIRLMPPLAWSQGSQRKEFGLIEGEAWVGSAARMLRPLGRLNGWGAPLELRPRPYNYDDTPFILASEVYDTGNIAMASLNSEANQLHLRLHQPIEPDAQYEILWWDINGNLNVISAEESAVQDDRSWRLDMPKDASEPLVVAISYEGVRMGAWWRDDWAEQALDLSQKNPMRTAALLRYFKVPLCSSNRLQHVQKMFRSAPGETLAAWLSNEGLPEGRRYRSEEAWDTSLRILISDWEPDKPTTKRLLKLLKGETNDLADGLLAMVDRLIAICPLLAARTVRVCRNEVLGPNIPLTQIKKTLRQICCRLLDLAPQADDTQLRQRKNDLVADTAATLGLGIVNAVDTSFVTCKAGGLLEKSVDLFEGNPISSVQQSNLDITFATVEPFRRLVAVTLIQSLI